MKLQKSINELKQIQKEFDIVHQGNIPFYEEITEKNIEVLEHLIVCTLGELGEFANIVKKIKRGDFTLSDKKDELSEEITDVFIYLLKISNQMNIDLEKEYFKKMQINKKKFEKFLK